MNGIIDLREELGLNVQEMADLLEVSTKTIERWERNGTGAYGGSQHKVVGLMSVLQHEATKGRILSVLRKYSTPVSRPVGLAIVRGIVGAVQPILESGELRTLIHTEISAALQQLR